LTAAVVQHGSEQQDIPAPRELPPMLLVHGAVDDTVPATSSEEFAAAAVAVGWDCSIMVLERRSHADLVLELMLEKEGDSPLVEELARWMSCLQPTVGNRLGGDTVCTATAAAAKGNNSAALSSL
jgi:dienelactone hydrolase